MKPIVHIVLLGNPSETLSWPLGEVWPVEKTPQALAELVREKGSSLDGEAWLFWDAGLGVPHADSVLSALSLPGDVWHAGLRLGMNGLPGLINFVQPTWMLNRDPDPSMVASSWRLTLRACLIRTSVLRGLGSVCTDFIDLDGASLEMGHRYVMNGAILRNVPWLIPNHPAPSTQIPFEDEWRFILYRMGRKWTYWALFRALLTGYASVGDVLNALRSLQRAQPPSQPSPFRQTLPQLDTDVSAGRVSILIPTLDRYDYLRRLLSQLRDQTIPPFEIILVDQSEKTTRVTALAEENRDLPLKILYRDSPGQCSARNAGLEVVRGDFVLFLDDDDEVPPDLIEAHLKCLRYFHTPVSCGVADEVDAGPLPEGYQKIRISDIFPTNNAMIHLSAVEKSGLFDVAYDRDWGDDHDLGMRMYLNGILMILNPRIRVLHHHASSGGLRTHGARVITYAISRKALFHRQIPSPALIYGWKRYFSEFQVREKLGLSALGTLSHHGNVVTKVFKLLLGIFLLPGTLFRVRQNTQRANQMLVRYPEIPRLTPQRTLEEVSPVE
jgi:glycosyltransferase involved in cell wall biosynthesis